MDKFSCILNKIGDIVPIFSLKCVLYDEDEGVETGGNDNNNELNNNLLIPTKFQNIKINLYSFVNEQIEFNRYEVADSLDQIYNTKRKLFEYS